MSRFQLIGFNSTTSASAHKEFVSSVGV